jgi:hypothetical protein
MSSVAHDTEGIRQAALTLFAEPLAAAQLAKAKAAMRGKLSHAQLLRLEEEYAVPRPLGEGYYERAGYLLWLDRLFEVVPSLPLNSEQFAGLEAVRAARAEFEAAHPPCAKCGMRLDSRLAQSCWSCLQSTRGAA